MINLKPILIRNGVTTIHPLRNSDLEPEKLQKIKEDLFAIYSNEETIKFIPHKKTSTIEDVEKKINKIRFGYNTKGSYAHFVTLDKFDKIIGEINIISPLGTSDYNIPNYDISDVWFIEYAKYANIGKFGIITNAVGEIIDRLKSQGVTRIGAVCFRENIDSIKILKNLNFCNVTSFDNYQDYYELK
jgi:RimJ/RimL family protein N-acetyltransferase